MIRPVNVYTWQILRTLVREEIATQTHAEMEGRKLRLWPNRITKDGTFLDDLVERGLLTCREPSSWPTKIKGGRNFYKFYKLTDYGRWVAEYGNENITKYDKTLPGATPVPAEEKLAGFKIPAPPVKVGQLTPKPQLDTNQPQLVPLIKDQRLPKKGRKKA